MTGKEHTPEPTRIARPSAALTPEARALPGQKLIDVTPAARSVGFAVPVFITAKAHGQVVKPGTPVGEGLWEVLEEALRVYRSLPKQPRPDELRFYAPWLQSNRGIVSLNLDIRRHGRRTVLIVIATSTERR